jgi:superoxide dismutase, Cu-Zn family
MNLLSFRTVVMLAGACLLSGNAIGSDASQRVTLDREAKAVAYLQQARHSNVVGTVQFIPTADGVRVRAHVENLTRGAHGIHIHEKGDLSAPDLSSAGGHFNPHNEPHAGPTAEHRHVGDLGNLDANTVGIAELDYVDPHLKLSGPDSILGKAVIVHQDPDDLKSQPSGNSGLRIAGGLIEPVGQK